MKSEECRKIIFETVGFEYAGEIETYQADGLYVQYDGKTAQIGYDTISSLCRGYFLFAKHCKDGKIDIFQKANFSMCGAMLDASRNGVMQVEAVKKYINYMAALGMNTLMLYTEDTYEVPEYPYFGYMRGRYSACEIRELDAYAKELGIELVPCIQTLAHLEQFLRHRGSESFKDTGDILLADAEETYRFIECEIRAVRSMFSSKRIHIGMDEAHDLGRGTYLDQNGYKPSHKILLKHLDRVTEICKQYDFVPMMWNDMFFRTAAPDKDYYNYKESVFSEELLSDVPEVDMVYWDYYHDYPEIYHGMIEKSKQIGRKVLFAGGIGLWYGFLPAGDHTERNTITALRACLEDGVDEVFATMWGDDGTETNIFFSVPYLPLYSELCYRGLDCTKQDIEDTAAFLTKIPYPVIQSMGRFNNEIDGNSLALMGKRVFYADIFYDLGAPADGMPEMHRIFTEALETITANMDTADKNYDWYAYAKLVFEIGLYKAELREKLRNAYLADDRAYLSYVAETLLPDMKEKLVALKKIHKKQWNAVYKQYGFEVLSFRYGGLISRAEDAMETISAYLDGKIDKIEPLAEKLLPTDYFKYNAKTVITPSAIY